MRQIAFPLLFFATITLAACSGGAGPADVVERSYRALEAGDVDAFTDTLQPGMAAAFHDKIPTAVEQEQAEAKQKGGIASIDILSEEVTDETEESQKTAKVHVRVTYGDDSTEEQEIALAMYDGEWKIEPSKG